MNRVVICLLVVLVCLPAFGQQSYINRYDVFTGYSYLRTPTPGLTQHGFNGTIGANFRRWFAMGIDFSTFSGNMGLTVNQTKLAPTLKTMLPSTLMGYAVPVDASTYTFAAGPQINIRKWERLTLFVRPGLGVMHEKIAIKYAGTPFAPLLPVLGTAVPDLKPSQADTVPFYGFGFGADIGTTKHVGLRVSFDYVRSSMFKSILPTQNNIRISIGPQFKFGEMKQTR
jgi:hypothetical protein